MHHLVLNYQKISIKCLIPHEISEIIQSNTLFHMKLVKSSNQIPITAYACCKYHETTNYKVLQFLFNQSNCLITIKYSVQPIKLLNYHQTTPFNQSNGSITVHLCHNYHELSIIIVFSDYPFLFPLSPYTFYATSTA